MMLNKIQRFLTSLQRRLQPEKRFLARLPGARKIQAFANRYKLLFAISSAIFVALALTAVSVFLYIITGTSKLDLSRPGYEGVREKVKQDNTDENSFGPNGALDDKTMKEFIDEYKKQSQRLSGYDAFNPKILDDNQLGLDTSTQTAPSDGAN